MNIAASDVKTLLQEPNPLLTSLSQLLNDSASGLGNVHMNGNAHTHIMLSSYVF